jgi:pilus assembly protein CpaB
MQRRLLTVIVFALLAAFISSTVLYKVISANSGSGAKAATVRIFVAARELAAGDVIKEADIQEKEWAAEVSSQWARAKTDLIGRGLLSGINKDEPFPENRLAPKGAGGGLAARIPSGMRAVAVHVDELSGLSRFLLPGMRVDVLSTGTARQKGGDPESPGMVTHTILQNVQVLSTGQGVERNSKEQPAAVQSVNLLVTPEQAEVLGSAMAQNRIQLVLRNPLDSSRVTTVAAAIPATHVAVKPVAVPPAAKVDFKALAEKPVVPSGPTVEVIHGTKKVVTAVGSAEVSEVKQ